MSTVFRRITAALVVLPLMASVVAAQDVAEICTAEQEAINDVALEAEQEGAGLERDSADLQNEMDADLSIQGHFVMRRQVWKFDIPEVSMKVREFSFHVPKTYMRTQEIKFSVPKSSFENKVVGYYIKCRKLKCRKEEIVTKVPVFYKGVTSIKFDIPEFEWARTSFKTKIPEFTRRRIEWVFDLPEFQVDNVVVDGKPVYHEGFDKRSKELEQRGAAIETKYGGLVASAVSSMNACVTANLLDSRGQIAVQFDVAIAAVTAMKAAIAASNGEMGSLIGEDGKPMDLDGEIARLHLERDNALIEIDSQISSLSSQSQAEVGAAGGEVM